MSLAHVMMLSYELLNKDSDLVQEQAPFIILDCKPDIYIAKNGKESKHTRHISKTTNFVRNGEDCNTLEPRKGGKMN